MANNSTAQQHQAVAAPGPQPILQMHNLRRPVAVNAYYSCSQQEWDSLIRITQTPSHTKAKWALKKLNKHDKAGQIHEVSDAQRAPAGVAPAVAPAAANPIVVAGPAIPSISNQPVTAPVFNQQVSAPVANPPGNAPALNQPGTVSNFTTPSILAASSQSANPPIVNHAAVAPVIQQALTSLIPTATTPIIHPIVVAPIVHAQRPSQPLSSVPPAPSILNGIPSTWIPVSNWAYVIPQPRGGTLTIPAPLRVQTSQQVHHAQVQ
ncbi:hypothetical protein D6C97_02754 [Aureobasidium pullulans]|nr:hypothetical protein D6C97_02754 [Aureobasidium pullulans]